MGVGRPWQERGGVGRPRQERGCVDTTAAAAGGGSHGGRQRQGGLLPAAATQVKRICWAREQKKLVTQDYKGEKLSYCLTSS